MFQTIVLKVNKILNPKHQNLQNKQEIQISAKHDLQNAVVVATSDPIT